MEVSKILNQMSIDRLQVNYGNPLLYPVNVINFPSPKRGVLCILIVDLIKKIALVLFNLLSASKNHFEKLPCHI